MQWIKIEWTKLKYVIRGLRLECANPFSNLLFLILLKDVQINFIDRKDFGGHEKEHLMVIDDSWLLSLINYSMGSHTCVCLCHEIITVSSHRRSNILFQKPVRLPRREKATFSTPPSWKVWGGKKFTSCVGMSVIFLTL